jgi:hypothetical protein
MRVLIDKDKGREVKSPGRLSRSIDRMELEQFDDGVKVVVEYLHFNLDDPKTMKAELFVPKQQLVDAGIEPTITGYFYEIGILFDLEVPKTVDWVMVKEVPDELEGTYDPNNQLQVAMLPGRVLWVAEGLR